ncbi:hypothetical protein X777_16236, partial [Ooceraea biroi]
KKFNINMSFQPNNSLHKFICVKKDPLDAMSHCNVVYKISCNECDASYVGQTKRQLHTRVNEHRRDINKRSGSPSVISTHKLDSGHDFKWNHVEILDEEIAYKKRMVSEMITIKRQLNPLNLQSDTLALPDVYSPILNIFPSK